MPRRRGSRYYNHKVYGIVRENAQGQTETRLYVAPDIFFELDLESDFTSVAYSSSAPLDLLAMRLTKNEMDWWLVAEASEIYDPYAVEDGDRLIVPGQSVFQKHANG